MEFKFPDVGEGIQEGVIVKWCVKSGDAVKRDQVLCEVETDKAVVEIPSPNDGVIDELYHKEGETIKVGEVLAKYHGADGVGAVAPKENGAGAVGAIQDADEMGAASGPLFDKLSNNRAGNAKQSADSEVKILPALRKLAEDLGVDLDTVKGTGPGGRITKKDIELAAGSSVTLPESKAGARPNQDEFGLVDYEALSPTRKAIARHLSEANSNVVPVTQVHFVDVTDLVAYRNEVKGAMQAEGVKLTYLAFVVKALILAVKDFPRFNAEWSESEQALILKGYVNVGIAVDTSVGLMVPVIANAEKHGLKQLAQDIVSLADRAQERKLEPAEMRGSSITISNYGSLGSVMATPVINYPNTCIVGLGSLQAVPKLVDGDLVEVWQMPISVTYDHRFIDGADCARFINKLAVQLGDREVFSMWLK